MWSNHSLPIDCRLLLHQLDHKMLVAVMIRDFLGKSVARHCQSSTPRSSYNTVRRLNLTSPIYSALSTTAWASWGFSPQLECEDERFMSHGRNSRLRIKLPTRQSRWMGFHHEPMEPQAFVPTLLAFHTSSGQE